ncbi:MAG: hypothetical protein IBX58_18245 [Roseovarius sp.]|nr:hypothetical protein [Roseovarius sp.]
MNDLSIACTRYYVFAVDVADDNLSQRKILRRISFMPFVATETPKVM